MPAFPMIPVYCTVNTTVLNPGVLRHRIKKSLLLYFTLFSLACFQSCGSSKGSQSAGINVSVQELEARGGVSKEECRTISDRIEVMLARTHQYVIVNRDQALATRRKELSTQPNEQNQKASNEAKILPIRKLILGSIGRLGAHSYSITVKMVDVESSNVDLAVNKIYSGDLRDLSDDFLQGIVHEITGTGNEAGHN